MADIVTGGRVIMGVGRGYHTREVETFGGPLSDNVKNREIFEEGVQLMLAAVQRGVVQFPAQAFHLSAGRGLSRL